MPQRSLVPCLVRSCHSKYTFTDACSLYCPARGASYAGARCRRWMRHRRAARHTGIANAALGQVPHPGYLSCTVAQRKEIMLHYEPCILHLLAAVDPCLRVGKVGLLPLFEDAPLVKVVNLTVSMLAVWRSKHTQLREQLPSYVLRSDAHGSFCRSFSAA